MENEKQEYTKEEQEKFEQAHDILSGLLSGKKGEGFLMIQISKSKGMMVGLEGDMLALSAAIYSILVSKDERNAVLKDIIKSGYILSENSVHDLTAIMKNCNNTLREMNDILSSALKKEGGKRK